MKELLEKIGTEIKTFTSEVEKFEEKGNQSAGRRARKASLELERLFKEFRKTSVGGRE